MRTAVFLDRDGTLIEERNYLCRPEEVRLLPGAAEALVRLRRHGLWCVVVTNQAGIGRGYFPESALHAVNAEMTRQLAELGAGIDGLYFCPLAPRTSDKTVVEFPDRKPGPGMLLKAARELNLDLPGSWMVGDSVADLLAGRHAGCRGSILVRSGHAIDGALAHLGPNDRVVEDLAEAAGWILNQPIISTR